MPLTGRERRLKPQSTAEGKAMTDITEIIAGPRWSYWRIAMWGAAAFLLSLPAIAMQLNAAGVDWSAADFMVMGVMLGVACGACELAARASGNGAFRLAAGIAIGTAFLTVWVNLAVGMVGSENDSFNLLFGGVLAIALTGAIVARFAAAAMPRAMIVTAIAQAAAGTLGISSDPRGAMFSVAFALPWLLSAWLFRKAARDRTL